MLEAGVRRRTLEVRRNRLRGDWEAGVPDAREPRLVRATREAAIEAAGEHLRKQGLGRVVVLNDTGKVVETKLIWPWEPSGQLDSQQHIY